MSGQKPFPFDVLEFDQTNVQVSVDVLSQHGIFECFQRDVPSLFAGLLPEVQNAAPAGFFPFTRKDNAGREIPTYDFILRLFMLQSADQQYIIALEHLLRGQQSDVPGHLRRAVEAAGIAYLSKSKPDLGDTFMSGDAKKLRNATATKKILPPNDPVTADLLQSMDFANELTHNNFSTFVGRIKQDISINDKNWKIEVGLNLYGGTDLGVFLRLALWMLRVMERVLRVLAASFDLPATSQWFIELEQLRRRLNQLYSQLDQIVNPIHSEANPTN